MARAGTSRRTSIREKFSQSNRSVSNALTSKSGKKEAGNKKRKMEYWSTIPRVVMMTFHPWKERLTIQCNSLFTHATSRSDKNSLKHVRETKNVKKKSNN